MRAKNLSKHIVSELIYGITSLVFLIIYIEGVNLKPGYEMGYCILYFYIVMPLVSFVASFIISLKKCRLFLLYPIFAGVLGIVIPTVIFNSYDNIGIFFALIPGLLGMGFGIVVNRK